MDERYVSNQASTSNSKPSFSVSEQSTCDSSKLSSEVMHVPFESASPPETQKTFRITRLTKLLTFGYIRMSVESDRHIPVSIQSEIVKYVNLFLVRLNYNLHGDVVSPDDMQTPSILSINPDVTLSAVGQALERNGPIKYKCSEKNQFIKFWMRFKDICTIYQLDRNRKNAECSLEDIMAIEEDPNRWVEVPDDYTKWTKFHIGYIDCVSGVNNDPDEPQEIGLEFYDPQKRVWPSRIDLNAEMSSSEMNEQTYADQGAQDWTRHLKVGDFADAKDYKGKWYESVIRYIEGAEDDRTMIVHFIGWNPKWDEKVSANSSILRRGTKTKGPHRPHSKRQHYR